MPIARRRRPRFGEDPALGLVIAGGASRVILASGLGAAKGVLLPSRRAFGICLSRSAALCGAWRRGREAEGDGLLNRYRGNPIVGSNPTVSATRPQVIAPGPCGLSHVLDLRPVLE